ncbi:MAG: hypothetical protein WDZ82_01175 [Candidatus Paceibacterota bacterium]
MSTTISTYSITKSIIAVPDRIAAFSVHVLRSYVRQAPAFMMVGLLKLAALTIISQALLQTIYLPYSSPDLVTPVSLLLFLGVVIVYTWSLLVFIVLVKGRHTHMGFIDAVRESIRLLPSFWLLAALVGTVVAVSSMFLVLPGIVLAVWFAPVFFVLVYEHQRGWRALETSFEYAVEHFWSVLVSLVLFVLFVYSIYNGVYILVADSAIVLNQGFLEVWQIDQWVIIPVVSVLTWSVILPLAVTFSAIAYERLTGRVTIESFHVFQPYFSKMYRLLMSFSHRHGHRHP